MRYLVALLVCLVACGSDDVVPDDDDSVTPPAPCAVGEQPLADGQCLAPGIAAEACAEGFAPEAEACVPILPAAPCEDGTTALPGDATCRPIAECGAGTWGEIAGATSFVDAGAAPGGSGTQAAPFDTIDAAVAAARAGAVIAIAAGSYVGSLTLGDKALTLWGRCPSMASLAPTAAQAILISGAAPVTVRGLAISGSGAGIDVVGGNATLQDLWIHDMTNIGVSVRPSPAAGSAPVTMLEDLHIARVVDVGVLVLGSVVDAIDVVIRDIDKTPSGQFGRGWDIEYFAATSAALGVDGTVVERVHEHGVYLSGSSATISRALVRDVSFNSDIDPGRGITARMNDAGVGSSLLLSDALIERSVDSAVTLAASDGALARVVLRDIAPRPSGLFGYGLSLLASLDGATVSSATWQAGLIERTHTLGVLVSGASLSADGLLIRDIAEEPLSGYFGRGITAQMLAFNETTDLTLRWSRIDRVRDAGVAVFNTHAWIEGVAIDTVGATLVDNTFGDGIDIFGGDPQSFATVRSSAVSNAARAGIANFASAVTVESNNLRCNSVDLNGEDGMLHDYAFIDEGGNVCGCPDQAPCKVFSSMLTPPTAPMPPTP